MNRTLFALPLLFLGVLSPSQAQRVPRGCGGMSLGQNASLNGFVPFPSNDPWRQDVSQAQVDGNSDAIIATIGATVRVHPDFGSGGETTQTIGIPYQVVSHIPNVPVNYNAYGNESDQGPMPIPGNALIEGYPTPDSTGDKHVLVLDRDNCFLYELYGTQLEPDGSATAASGAVWDLLNNNQRPTTWTSSDAAGLPVFPGLARYDEVARGHIDHALRFTLHHSTAAFVSPATHFAPDWSNPYGAPMGMRMRLRADFDISSFSPQAKVILTALKKYGMIMADNGGSMYVSGAPNQGWDNSDLDNLYKVTAGNFEVLQETPIVTRHTIPTGPPPTITSFTSDKPMRGGMVELNWTASGSSYYIVSPSVGPVRGNHAYVKPTVTTTYTLYATNGFGQTTATVQVVVP